MNHAISLHGGGQAGLRRAEANHAAILPELRRTITQDPLIETHASLLGLAHLRPSAPAPSGVFMGIGITSGSELSHALPLDVLGMLFAAEQVRQATRARELTLLLADAHALDNGHDSALVHQRALAYQGVLQRVLVRLGWSHVHMLRASELHARELHVRVHAMVRRAAPREEHPYVTREVADIEYFARARGPILKVGWALASRGIGLRDERAFDERFKRWVGPHVGFVYCKAGRALDDRCNKAAPYLVRDPARRVCLVRDECVHSKLQRAAAEVSTSTLRGVRRHLKAIARSYKQLVRPVRGTVEDQIQCVIGDLLGSEVAA